MDIWKECPGADSCSVRAARLYSGRLRQVVSVQQIHVRPAAPGGVERRQVIRHGLDGEAPARQVAEILRGLAVELLGDPGRMHQQFLRGLRVEARVGAQELQERGELTLEAGLAHGGDHLLVQPLHLCDPELVDLGGVHVEGGELEDLRAVVGLAVRQVLRGECRAHARHVFVAHEVQQLRVGRLDDLADGLHGGGLQFRLPRLGHSRHLLGEWRVEQARLRVAASVTAVSDASRPCIVTRGGVKPRLSPARISSICSWK